MSEIRVIRQAFFSQIRDIRLRAGGGIGRRVRLRGVWGNPWRFKSSPAHYYEGRGTIDEGRNIVIRLTSFVPR